MFICVISADTGGLTAVVYKIILGQDSSERSELISDEMTRHYTDSL